jgi:hypothetical protein
MMAMAVVMNVNGVGAFEPTQKSARYSGMSERDRNNRVYGKVAVSIICPSIIRCKTEPSEMVVPMSQPL